MLCPADFFSNNLNLIWKETRRAEHEYISTHTLLPPINVLATAPDSLINCTIYINIQGKRGCLGTGVVIHHVVFSWMNLFPRHFLQTRAFRRAVVLSPWLYMSLPNDIMESLNGVEFGVTAESIGQISNVTNANIFALIPPRVNNGLQCMINKMKEYSNKSCFVFKTFNATFGESTKLLRRIRNYFREF